MAANGVAVMVILHDLNLAARYCDQLLLLRSGQVRAFGSPAEVMRAEMLKAVFDLEVLVQTHPELGHPLIIDR
jgi:iron complex transport system ATP-binding protein